LAICATLISAPAARGECRHPADVTCNAPAAPPSAVSFSPIRASAGDWDIDVRDPYRHVYDIYVPDPRGASPRATFATDVRAELIRRPTPGDNRNSASAVGAPNNAAPWWSPVASPVRSFLVYNAAGEAVVYNVTERGHFLYPGYVARMVVDHGPSVSIRNVGEGLGWWQSSDSPIATPLNSIWLGQSRKLMRRARQP
jgi:hypothetical protein